METNKPVGLNAYSQVDVLTLTTLCLLDINEDLQLPEFIAAYGQKKAWITAALNQDQFIEISITKLGQREIELFQKQVEDYFKDEDTLRFSKNRKD